ATKSRYCAAATVCQRRRVYVRGRVSLKGAYLAISSAELDLRERRMECVSGRPGSALAPVLQLSFPGARASLLESLNRQRQDGRLCDLSIQVQGQVFRAHRCVLAACSPYFHDQVVLKNVSTVSLPSVMDPLAFESVLNSAYTGQLSILRDDIVSYVTVASFLQMWHIVDKCTDILKKSRTLSQFGSGGATSSSHQSPSSSDCCFADPEDEEEKSEKPSALPPLATWRRPLLNRYARSTVTFPLRVPEPECGSTSALHGCTIGPLPSFANPSEIDFTSRQRIKARLRGLNEFEEQRRMEADEGVGEISEVKVKSEERQAGGGRLDQRFGGCIETTVDDLWENADDFSLCGTSDEKVLDEDEDADLMLDEMIKPSEPISHNPSLPSELSWFNQSSSPPSSATPKIHFCHCGKAYALKSMRDRHVKMQHLNLRPFSCPLCSKRFKMKHHLTKHAKTHGGVRMNECTTCGKKMAWRDGFLKHQARCQKNSSKPDMGETERVKEEQEDPSVQEEPSS
ncbi:hypothetical protein DNTS_008413, partial [Danionella cerebrum]